MYNNIQLNEDLSILQDNKKENKIMEHTLPSLSNTKRWVSPQNRFQSKSPNAIKPKELSVEVFLSNS